MDAKNVLLNMFKVNSKNGRTISIDINDTPKQCIKFVQN